MSSVANGQSGRWGKRREAKGLVDGGRCGIELELLEIRLSRSGHEWVNVYRIHESSWLLQDVLLSSAKDLVCVIKHWLVAKVTGRTSSSDTF